MNINFDTIWQSILTVIVKSLCVVEDVLLNNSTTTTTTDNDPSSCTSFEIFGYDILIDDQCKAWLIEVNSSPSMEYHCDLDRVKHQMIRDAIHLLHCPAVHYAALAQVLERKCKQKTLQTRNTNKSAMEEWNMELHRIFAGQVPRKYGEMPLRMGDYERIAPSKTYSKFCKKR